MKQKLLVIGSVEESAHVLELMFSDKFAVVIASETEQAIAFIQKEKPTLAIFDCDQKDISVLDIAEKVSQLPSVERCSMIALGTKVEDEALKTIFKAGIADFVEKPFNVVAFHQRISRFSRDAEQIKTLHENDKRKHNLAQTAMKQSSFYGSGLDLLAKLNNINNVDSFLSMVTRAIESMGYHCAIEFRYQEQTYSLDSDIGRFSDVEQRVFDLLKDKGRIYSFGSRMMFNDKQASLLIKNMPIQGTSSYDAAIDLFAKLIPALNARFLSLLNQMTMQESSNTLTKSINIIREQLTNMEIARKDRFQDISTAISLSFHELEFTEVQEQFFLNLIEKKLEQNSSDETFNKVVNLLKECAAKLETESSQQDTAELDDLEDDDMELF